MRNYRGWGRWASLVTQLVKNLPTVQSDRVLTSGQGDPLEKGMATHSSVFAWNIPWTEKPGGLQSQGRKESDMTKHAKKHYMYSGRFQATMGSIRFFIPYLL